MKYDMHIATEAGDSASLKKSLAELGFKDDNLATRELKYDLETAKYYTSCPLIDVHASKKVADPNELQKLEVKVDQLMEQTDSTGYWHSEKIWADAHIETKVPFTLRSLPFERLLSRPRNEEKVWDIHVAFLEDLMPIGLSEALVESGIYYMARMKKLPEGGEGKFAVYTVQGINPLDEGKRFYRELCQWLMSIGAPPCDIKLEETTKMKLYNSPKAVPPTVDHIIWR